MANEIKIIISQLEKKHINQAAFCLANGFLHEPMTKEIGITFDEMQEFTQNVVAKVATKKLSLVAIDSEAGKVAGVSINKDLLDSPLAKEDEILDKFIPIFDLLDQLYFDWGKLPKIKYYDILK